MSSIATFDFRINYDYYSADELRALLPLVAKKWAFQGEVGVQRSAAHPDGYHHWQGRLSLHRKRRVGSAKSLILNRLRCNYLEPTSGECTRTGAMFYVLKDDTYDGLGKHSDKDPVPEYVPDHIRDATPSCWQREILATAEILDLRAVDVLFDPVGNLGKSYLLGFAIAAGLSWIPNVNDPDRLVASVCNILSSRGCRTPKLFIMDLPRSLNKERISGFMRAVETIKDGRVYDARYNFKQWIFNPPRVWLMTNELLPARYLSSDRWRIWIVVGETLQRYTEPWPLFTAETISLDGTVAEFTF